MNEYVNNELLVTTPLEELDKHVPTKAIQELIEKHSEGESNVKYLNKQQLLKQIKILIAHDNLSIEQVNQLIQDYKFAGRVSVSWGIPVPWTSLTQKQLEQIIVTQYKINPFQEELKPKLTSKPSFNYAEWLTENLLKLEFTYAGKIYEVEDNYQTRKITPTKRINAYIRLSDKLFFVETRANIQESRLIYKSLSDLLGIDIIGMEFTDFDIDYLKQELNAKAKSVKYKRHGGDFDTVYVSASPNLDDLYQSNEFIDKFTDGDLRQTRLEFSYFTPSHYRIDTSMSISYQGNIWFMTDIPEEIIDYVFEIIKQIKIVPPAKKLALKTKVDATEDNQIEHLIYTIRQEGYGKRFNPRIYQTLKIDVNEKLWMERISKLVQFGYLIESFELVCPACHETIKIYDNLTNIPLEEAKICHHCGSEFKISEKDIILMYAFREDVNESKTSNSNKTLILQC